MDHVLVIGCGYLGQRVGAELLALGARVTATTTQRRRLPELRRLGFAAEFLDLERSDDSAVWGAAYDAALYAVASRREEDPSLPFHTGAIEAASRLRTQEGRTLERFVFISSTGVYPHRDGSWVDEETAAEPTDERHQTLRAGERDLLSLARGHGFPAVVLRLGGLYGPGRSPVEWLTQPKRKERVLRGGREAFMNWIRVEDAAQAAVLALGKGAPGEVYLATDGEPVPRGDFYRAAAERAGLPPPELPSYPHDLGKRCRIRKARADLGYAPRFASYREGLAAL